MLQPRQSRHVSQLPLASRIRIAPALYVRDKEWGHNARVSRDCWCGQSSIWTPCDSFRRAFMLISPFLCNHSRASPSYHKDSSFLSLGHGNLSNDHIVEAVGYSIQDSLTDRPFAAFVTQSLHLTWTRPSSNSVQQNDLAIVVAMEVVLKAAVHQGSTRVNLLTVQSVPRCWVKTLQIKPGEIVHGYSADLKEK